MALGFSESRFLRMMINQKKSKVIQKSYWALKMQENQLPINQILRQLQAFAE